MLAEVNEGANRDSATFGLQESVKLPVGFALIVLGILLAYDVEEVSAVFAKRCQSETYADPVGIVVRHINMSPLDLLASVEHFLVCVIHKVTAMYQTIEWFRLAIHSSVQLGIFVDVRFVVIA